MRLSKWILAATLGLMILLPQAASGENAGPSLTVGVPTDRCPVFYLDAATGEITGIGVDLMRSAADAAGYTVSFQSIGEATLKDALDSEAYDVVMPFGSAIASAAGEPSVVSDNLIQTPFTLITGDRREMPPLNDIRVGMLSSLSGAAETVRLLFPGIEISMFETMDECVNALREGGVDALLHNSYVWSYVLQKPAYRDLVVQPSAMFSMDFRAGTRDTREGRAIIERLNGGIASLTDTRRQAIVLDHTSRRLYKYDVSDYLYQYGLIILLIALLFAALIVIAVQRVHAVRKEQEEKMRYLIDHDSLTGALSMEGFRRRVEELLRLHPDTRYFLSYNNIKNFKYINESLGMKAGDELLRFWVRRTRNVLTDAEAIGRITDDRFAVLRISGADEKVRADDQAVIDSVRNYFVERGKGNQLQICSGIYVLAPRDFRKIDVDHMLDFARAAEKRIRSANKDGYEFYNPEQWEKGKRTADIINRLSVSVQNGEIQVWYQPQVDYAGGQIIGAEALCRWNHGKLGWLNPAEFIPALEESGHIYELDCCVWEKVCQDLHRWNGKGRHRSVSVNLSRNDLKEGRDIPAHFRELIQAYGLTADQLRVEITETAYAEDPDLLISTTRKLRQMGFQTEMDDFGSGYSSLHMLKEVPVDRIKLDLNFLTGKGDPEKGRIIVSSMIQMLRLMGLKLITEGVETDEQARFLGSQGCSEMQGYYFCKPVPCPEFEEICEKGRLRPAEKTR